MGKVTYTDKVQLNENADVADINKCKADDLNEIKNVINENVKYVVFSAGTDGKFYATVTGTLESYDIIRAILPNATNGSANAEFSLNGSGGTYKDVYNQIGQLIASRIQNKVLDFYYDGTQWKLLDESKVFKGCIVTKTTTQSSTSGTGFYVAFDDEDYDTDGFHDNSTNNTRLTIPAGVSKVRVWGNLSYDDSDTSGVRFIAVRKNGVYQPGSGFLTVPGHSTGPIGAVSLLTMTPTVNVVAGDYFELRGYQDSGSTLDVKDGNLTVFALEVIE